MTRWDGAAYERLTDIVTGLRDEGVIDLFERIIARVWQINVDRFEPAEVGDTNRSLGITATENIRTLVMKAAWPNREQAGLGASVRVTAPNDSLLVEAAGVRLHVMKSAPALTLAEPRWDSEFTWKGESDVRIDAATANAHRYNPLLAVPGSLFEDMLPPPGSADRLREVILIWSGGSNSPLTGGWVGLPTLGERPWLAVQSAWWHGAGGVAPSQREDEVVARDAFSDRDAPSPVISLRPQRRTAQQ